jgi:hypothetical protein
LINFIITTFPFLLTWVEVRCALHLRNPIGLRRIFGSMLSILDVH